MTRKRFIVVLALALTAGACGAPADGGEEPHPDAPLLQIRSEGGFAPVEFVLGRGPTYTLLNDGRLISEGPVAAIYPGPLVPNYLVGQVSEDDLAAILSIVDDMGLDEITEVADDSAADFVADATTEVVTYWDENGTHVYSVYALGIEPDPENPMTAGFLALLDAIGNALATVDAVPYEGETARVVAGVAMAPIDPEFEDVREWPLDDDTESWTELPNGWRCQVFDSEILTRFEDATQATTWLHPDPMMDAPTYTLLVRPLHPGEPDCPA